MQLQRGMKSESSFYSQLELRPRLQHTSVHLRIATTGTSSSLRTILRSAIGYLYVMKLQISSSRSGMSLIKSLKGCYWEHIDYRTLVGRSWRR